MKNHLLNTIIFSTLLLFGCGSGSSGSSDTEGPSDIPVTKIEIVQATLSLIEGGSTSLSTKILPSDATLISISWTSSDENIATVDNNGVVTAVSAGTVTITATYDDNSDIKDTSLITVTGAPITPVTPILVNSITLSSSRNSIPENSTETFTATITPSNADNNKVVWSSSNTAVAKVDATTGLVTAISQGESQIIATATDGSEITGSVLITVTALVINEMPILVSSITVSSSETSIVENSTQAFTSTIAPANATNKKVAWSSSKPAVATVNVNTGLVTAVSKGESQITAEATDGSGATGSATVTVTSSASILVEGISVSSSKTSISENSTQAFTATITPVNATNKNVVWSSSNPDVATIGVNTGLVIAVSTGNTQITAEASDGSGITGSANLTVTPSPASIGAVYEHDFNNRQIGSGASADSFWTLQATGGVGNTPAMRLEYSESGTANKAFKVSFEGLNTNEAWIEFDVRAEGTISGGSKFVKFFGNKVSGQSYNNWNNMTFGMHYSSNSFFDVGYFGDSIRTVRYDGSTAGSGSPNIVTSTGTFNIKDGVWRHWKIHLKRGPLGTDDGEMQVWVDGVTKIHATNLNINPDWNGGSTYLTRVEVGGYNGDGGSTGSYAKGYFENGVSPTWYLWMDNLYVGLVEKGMAP